MNRLLRQKNQTVMSPNISTFVGPQHENKRSEICIKKQRQSNVECSHEFTWLLVTHKEMGRVYVKTQK